MNKLFNTSNFSGLDPRYVGLSNAIQKRQRKLALGARPDVQNVFISKSAIPMGSSVVMTALFRCVGIIVGLCSGAKMIWIHARRVIARVHNDHSVWDRPLKSFVRVSVSPNHFSTGHHKDAVPVPIPSSTPDPTGFCFFKAIHKNIFRTKHGVLPKASRPMERVVAFSTKLSSNCKLVWVINAIQFIFWRVSHRNPPLEVRNMPYSWSL